MGTGRLTEAPNINHLPYNLWNKDIINYHNFYDKEFNLKSSNQHFTFEFVLMYLFFLL